MLIEVVIYGVVFVFCDKFVLINVDDVWFSL